MFTTLIFPIFVRERVRGKNMNEEKHRTKREIYCLRFGVSTFLVHEFHVRFFTETYRNHFVLFSFDITQQQEIITQRWEGIIVVDPAGNKLKRTVMYDVRQFIGNRERHITDGKITDQTENFRHHSSESFHSREDQLSVWDPAGSKSWRR